MFYNSTRKLETFVVKLPPN